MKQLNRISARRLMSSNPSRWIVIAFAIVLSGCAAAPKGPQTCVDTCAKRPLSDDDTMVVWWGSSMRDNLLDGVETTTYDLTL